MHDKYAPQTDQCHKTRSESGLTMADMVSRHMDKGVASIGQKIAVPETVMPISSAPAFS